VVEGAGGAPRGGGTPGGRGPLMGRPPTGIPSMANSSAVPVRTDSTSNVPFFIFSPATGQLSFQSNGLISRTLAPPRSKSASQCIENFWTPLPMFNRPKCPGPIFRLSDPRNNFPPPRSCRCPRRRGRAR